MPGKEAYAIEDAVPVHTGGGIEEAPAGTVLGTVVGAPASSTTMNSLAAGYGGDAEAGWEPPPRRRGGACQLRWRAAVVVLAVVALVGVVLHSQPWDWNSRDNVREGDRGQKPASGYRGDTGGQREQPTAPPPAPLEFAVTLNEDIATIPEGSNARDSFERSFVEDLAASLAIRDTSTIHVTGITAGSLTVSFQVIDLDPNLDVVGVLTAQRPELAGAIFLAAVQLRPIDAGHDERCTSRLSCATLAMPDMVAQQTDYSWFDIETEHNLIRITEWTHPTNSWPADDGFVTVQLDFGFSWYGLVEREVSIGTNGYLTFGEMDHYPYGNTMLIPTPGGDIGGATVDGLLAVMWTDLDPSAGGAVYHQGNREQLIVTWHTLPYFSSNRTLVSSGSTFQAILYASGDVIMQYESIERPDFDEDNSVEIHAVPSIGFENHDGSKGSQLAYGWDKLPLDESAWLVRQGVARWVANRPEHALDSALVCGESHLESHLFSNRVASRRESLADRGSCHGGDDSVTSGWEHAANLCGVLGARLCTLAELENGETAASGCGHDNEQTWASDPPRQTRTDRRVLAEDGRGADDASCPHGSHWATSRTSGIDNKDGVPGRTCVSDSSNLAVRCCADAVVSTPCALPPYGFASTAGSPPPPNTPQGAPPPPSTPQRATPIVTAADTSIDGHVTLLLSLQLRGDVRNVYSMHGGSEDSSELYFPPAYQVAPPFGVHIGGVPQPLWALADGAQWDSWLTFGLTSGNSEGRIASIGVDFELWSEQIPLTADQNLGGAVFCMDPDTCPHNDGSPVVVAQLTMDAARVGTGDTAMVATMALQGRSVTGDDWNQDQVVFQL